MNIADDDGALHARLRAAEAIALQAGEVILRHFDDESHGTKADGTPVTLADTQVNRLVIERISELFPGDGIVGEEESTTGYGPGGRWLCDPLDGTLGYTWGMPTAMFSLAFVVDGTPVVGVAYDPFLQRLYRGMRGLPSACNERPVTVSNRSLADGVVAVTGNVARIFRRDPIVASLVAGGVAMASFSGAVYKACLVARGRLVGYVETVVSPYDMAAVQLIVEGAGGRITALDGGTLDYGAPFRGAVVSNGVVHDALVGHASAATDGKRT